MKFGRCEAFVVMSLIWSRNVRSCEMVTPSSAVNLFNLDVDNSCRRDVWRFFFEANAHFMSVNEC